MREPKCTHERLGIVTSGDPNRAHAATQVCGLRVCIEDAMKWATEITGEPARYVSDFEREKNP